MIKNVNDQSDEEVRRARFERVPRAGAAVPAKLGGGHHPPGIWMCLSTWKLPTSLRSRVFIEL